MAYYLKFPGFKGSVSTGPYKGWIKLNSFQMGIGRGVSMEPGNMENRKVSRPSLSEISITKEMDQSSVDFFQNAAGGSKSETVEIHFVKTAEDGKAEKAVTFELTDCIVSSWSVHADGGAPSERVSLSYSKIVKSMSVGGTDNKNKTTTSAGYCLKEGAPT